MPRNGYALTNHLPTFAQRLRDEAGYKTTAIGKLHLAPHNAGIIEGPAFGFEHIENSEDPKVGPFLDWALDRFPQFAEYYIGTLFNLPTNEAYWQGRRDVRREVEACRERHVKRLEISDTCNWGYGHYSPLPPEAHQTTWITDRAIEAVKRHQVDDPLLLWVGYQDPHNPFDPPQGFNRMYQPEGMPNPIEAGDPDDPAMPPHLRAFQKACAHFTDRDWRALKALYYGSVSFLDDSIGRLIGSVEQKLDMSNTIVIYTSDHGELLGDHGIHGKWAYHYDACTRVPMIWRGDGRWVGGRRCDNIVELADFAPTLLEAAGVETAEPVMDGVSYHALLEGQPHPSGRDHAYIESFNGAPTDPTPAPDCWPRTVRSERYRCTFYPDPAIGELYDLSRDPDEQHNVFASPEYQEVVNEHRQRLLTRLMLMDNPLPPRQYAV